MVSVLLNLKMKMYLHVDIVWYTLAIVLFTNFSFVSPNVDPLSYIFFPSDEFNQGLNRIKAAEHGMFHSSRPTK